MTKISTRMTDLEGECLHQADRAFSAPAGLQIPSQDMVNPDLQLLAERARTCHRVGRDGLRQIVCAVFI